MTDGSITLRWTPPNARPRKIVLEPRSVGGYHRLEFEWDGDDWRLVGEEIVADVELEAPAAIVQNGSPTLGGQ